MTVQEKDDVIQEIGGLLNMQFLLPFTTLTISRALSNGTFDSYHADAWGKSVDVNRHVFPPHLSREDCVDILKHAARELSKTAVHTSHVTPR